VRTSTLLVALFALGAGAAEPGTATPPPNPAEAKPQATPPPPTNPHAMGGAPHGMPPGFAFNPPPTVKLTPQDVKDAFYAIGQSVGKGVGDSFSPTKEEWAELKKGLMDQVDGKALRVKPEDIQMKARQLERDRREVRHQADLKKNETELAKLAKEPGMQKLPSGVMVKVLTKGTGEQPKPTDTVSVNYKGTLTDGKEFDSSYKRGKPAEFPLNGVIKCWTEGVGAMKVGEKAKLVCPSDLAYGPASPPGSGIPPDSILIFEVELLSVKAGSPPPSMPPGMGHPMGTPPPPPSHP
jgi:FKBP-type peptidyl-prolyl cis-trans isomerase FkpA